MQTELPVFIYSGRIELRNTISITKEVLDTLEKNAKGVLVSMKKCGSFATEEDIVSLCQNFEKVQKDIKVDIAFIDYSPALFERIKKVSGKYPIKLFNSIQTATLFLNPKSLNEELKILLYEPNKAARDSIKKALTGSKYKLYIAKDNESYKNISQLEKIDITISQTVLNVKKASKAKPGKKLHISKNLVTNLPLFIDTAVETLSMITELDAQKSKHGIGNFKSDFDDMPLAALMKFSGSFSGTFFLIFPKSIACRTLSAMMGEEISDTDIEALKDGVGEFCNIITGSIKSKLQKKDLFITFELPKTYENVVEAASLVKGEEGIWIDMFLDKDPFYIFISS